MLAAEPEGLVEPSVELAWSDLTVDDSPVGVIVAEGLEERMPVDEGAGG